MSEPTHLKVGEVAATLQISPMQVHSLITDGELRATNVGRGGKKYWRVSRSDLQAFLDERAVGGAA